MAIFVAPHNDYPKSLCYLVTILLIKSNMCFLADPKPLSNARCGKKFGLNNDGNDLPSLTLSDRSLALPEMIFPKD